MIAREEARLRSLFQRLLVLSAAVVPASCSSTGGAGGGALDASAGGDATLPSDDDAGEGARDASIDATTADAGGPDTGAIDDAATSDALDPYGYDDAACDPQYLADRDGGDCDFFEYLPCGLPPGSPTEQCALLVAQCGLLCSHVPTQNRRCAVAECLAVDASSVPTGPVTLDCATGAPQCGPGIGRRPEGLRAARPARARGAIGAALAEMAHLEAASVGAFRRLRAELAALDAPASLVRAAERAAEDEIRHARVTAGLARRRGAKPAPVVLAPRARRRALVDFAIENAVEGCVRECFGALVATRQATRARDAEIATAMAGIAGDETRHAALAWAIARWLAPRLTDEERGRVASAAREALVALRGEMGALCTHTAHELGLPAGAEARALVDAFAAACGARLAA